MLVYEKPEDAIAERELVFSRPPGKRVFYITQESKKVLDYVKRVGIQKKG